MCANSDQSMLAAGCEEGQVRLVEILSDGLCHVRGLDKQEGRILSLAWHPSGEFIVTGGADGTIRKYDVTCGRSVLRITLERYGPQSTLVWSVKCLSDSTIISADSCGKVNFWNGVHGTLNRSFHSHKADTLAIAVSAHEDAIYVSGIDPKILRLQKLKEEKSWVVAGDVCFHTHDVRCLAVSKSGVLVSGGIDTNIMMCPTASFARDSRTEYPPFANSASRFILAPSRNLLMYQAPTEVKLWRVTSNELESSSNADGLEMALPTSVMEIKAKGPLHISSSAISSDASFVALCNVQEMWLYKVDVLGRVPRAEVVWKSRIACYKMQFTPDSRELVLASIGTKGILVLSLIDVGPNSEPSQLDLVQQKKEKGNAVFTDIEIGPTGEFMAATTSKKRIYLYSLRSRCLISKVPHLDVQPVVFCFDPPGTSLFLFSGENRELFKYSFAEERLSSMGTTALKSRYKGRKKLMLPNQIIVLSAMEFLFAVYDNDCLVIIRASSGSDSDVATGKKRKLQQYLRYQLVFDYQVLLFVAQFGQNRLITVERPIEAVLKGLPPTFARNRYGT
eukprot:Em0023g243a